MSKGLMGTSVTLVKFMTIDCSCPVYVCVCARAGGNKCVCSSGSRLNPTGVRSHHIKPIMAKQAIETNESLETPSC